MTSCMKVCWLLSLMTSASACAALPRPPPPGPPIIGSIMSFRSPAGFSGAFQGAPCGLRGRCGGPERDPPGRPLFFDPSRPLRAAILSSGTWTCQGPGPCKGNLLVRPVTAVFRIRHHTGHHRGGDETLLPRLRHERDRGARAEEEHTSELQSRMRISY